MSQFLVLVPKTDRSLLDSPGASERSMALLRRVAASYRSFLGVDEDPDPSLVAASASGTAAVLSYSRRGARRFQKARGDVWALTAGQDRRQALEEELQRLGGRLTYRSPVYGRYAVVYGERWMDRVTAWNTVPAFEGIHWGEGESFVYISNRPLLAALAMAGGAREGVRLSEAYAADYLTVGYSLSGRTPFSGVHTVPVGSALAVQGGVPVLEPVPAGLEADLPRAHSAEEAGVALAEALQRAAHRAVAELGSRPLQLRLSGGKDSRLLLGLFRSMDIDLSARTFGHGGDIDVRIARRLATMAGVPHTYGSPRVLDGEHDSARIVETIRQAGGIPLSEPHTIRYLGADVPGPGHAVSLGQWPLFKGGMARTMRNSFEATRERLRSALSPLVAPAVGEPSAARLDDWIRSQPATSQLEKQYLFGRTFRSGPYLQAHIAHYSRDAMLIYPFGDQEVAAVSDALNMAEQVSERAFFIALRTIWPEALHVPLDKSVWRFEVDGPDPDLSGAGYEDRYTSVPFLEDAEDRAGAPALEHAHSTSEALVRAMAADGSLDEALSWLRSDVAGALRRVSAGESLASPAGVASRDLTKFIWRLRTVDLWRQRAWLDQS